MTADELLLEPGWSAPIPDALPPGIEGIAADPGFVDDLVGWLARVERGRR